ncbi:MAG: ribbon-helix-helix domain-containing protein [Methanoregula sp.]
MEKCCISLPEKQVSEVEKKVSSGEYPNFSEVVRSALREFIERHPNAQIVPINKEGAPA